ncbi:oxygenase MpaB family protein [Daejeonella oryzae]|uniref:oxygenase MpaB family protein n=1 Tax=Daejeonella oryzae TaxID=1122943 RepID=UPI0004156613|nr:oxygenase MpaB family protein [Daejeonella oryzae]
MSIFNNQFLDKCRSTSDNPADQFIQQNFETLINKTKLKQNLDDLHDNAHFLKFQDSYPNSALLKDFSDMPSWANQKKMNMGSAFFVRFAEPIMNLLGLLSLPYCYAAADGARVLSMSERIKTNPKNRFSETAAFVWDVMAPNAFESTGKGLSGILKVRLIHASIRFYINQTNSWNQEWGLPLNQEDMAGTNLSFSLITLRGLRKMGFVISYEEQDAYIHLWNVIGYFLGLNEQLLPKNGLDANALENSIRQRQFKYSEHGSQLSNQLIDFMISNADKKVSRKDLSGLMRYLLTDEVADLIGIEAINNQTFNPLAIKFFSSLQHLMSSTKSYQYQQSKFQQKIQDVKNPFGLPMALRS